MNRIALLLLSLFALSVSAQEPPTPSGMVMVPAMPTAELMGHIQMLQDRVRLLQTSQRVSNLANQVESLTQAVINEKSASAFTAGWQAGHEHENARQQQDREVASWQVKNQPKENTVSIGLLFWIIMICGLLFGGYTNRATVGPWLRNDLVLWILLALLGYAVFGAAVHR